MQKLFRILIFSLFPILISCGKMRINQKIVDANLPGVWTSDSGELGIQCSGSASYKRTQKNTIANFEALKEMEGAQIAEFSDQIHFKFPFFMPDIFWSVQKKPYQNKGGEWLMEIDYKKWKRTYVTVCRENLKDFIKANPPLR